MPSNIEIKFRVNDLLLVERAVAEITSDGPELLIQEDVYFPVPRGRLKLRKFADGEAELIAYNRSDEPNVRESHWQRYPTGDADALQTTLAATLGTGVTVCKRRTLYLIDQTRVHLDTVDRLGTFVELEVVLRTGQSQAGGTQTADRLIQKLGLANAERIAGSYANLLGALEEN
jgi:predicted adenylyl cyclase CyaB